MNEPKWEIMTVSSNMHVINLAILYYIWWLMVYLKDHTILKGHQGNGAKFKSISHIWTYFQSLFDSFYTC